MSIKHRNSHKGLVKTLEILLLLLEHIFLLMLFIMNNHDLFQTSTIQHKSIHISTTEYIEPLAVWH